MPSQTALEKAAQAALKAKSSPDFDDDEMPPASRRAQVAPVRTPSLEELFSSPAAVMTVVTPIELSWIVYEGNPDRYAGKYLTMTAAGDTYTLEDGVEAQVPREAAEELLAMESEFYTIKLGTGGNDA